VTTDLEQPAIRTASPGAFGFPIMLEVRDRVVLVAGTGHEPSAKARQLAELGAHVRHWDPADAPWNPGLLDEALIAIVSTGDRVLDRQIAADARARRVLVNTIDDIPACDWSAPAILRRGDLTVAVATGGIAPALAARLRDRVADELGPEYGGLLELLGELRPEIMATGRPFADRRRLWYELVDSGATDLLARGDRGAARARLRALVDAWLAAQ
jgi:precorrin-2 dehydrogenase/sirohydrochlorin ferrochelatase